MEKHIANIILLLGLISFSIFIVHITIPDIIPVEHSITWIVIGTVPILAGASSIILHALAKAKEKRQDKFIYKN